jgi:predicted  nucleic acid-binding Zn-ribbon protein
MWALIEQILRDGCPNCGSTKMLRRRWRRLDQTPKVVSSLSCLGCSIEWQAPAVHGSELT